MKAYLILEDGTVFEGRRIGADRDVVCEVVFNTAMAGYLEVLTDPSYAGQGVAMTYPLMGNYGINEEDAESRRPWASAFIVQSVARRASNYRSEEELDRYLSRYDIPGIAGLDTRALTRHLRTRGTMNAFARICRFRPVPRLRAITALPAWSRWSAERKWSISPARASASR